MKKCNCLCHEKNSETHGAAYQRNACWCYGCDECRKMGLETESHYKPTNTKKKINRV